MDKILLSFSGENAEKLQAYAAEAGLSIVELLARALKIAQLIDQEKRKGNRLVVQNPEGRLIKDLIC